jgi:hypothetical protein
MAPGTNDDDDDDDDGSSITGTYVIIADAER